MAYAIKIIKKYQVCSQGAVREVFNRRNASHGYFCNRHAAEELRRLTEAEERADLKLIRQPMKR